MSIVNYQLSIGELVQEVGAGGGVGAVGGGDGETNEGVFVAGGFFKPSGKVKFCLGDGRAVFSGAAACEARLALQRHLTGSGAGEAQSGAIQCQRGDLRAAGGVQIALFHSLYDLFVGQRLGADHGPAAAHGVGTVGIVAGHHAHAATLRQKVTVDMAVVIVVAAQHIVGIAKLQTPQRLQLNILGIVLPRPHGVVVDGQEALFLGAAQNFIGARHGADAFPFVPMGFFRMLPVGFGDLLGGIGLPQVIRVFGNEVKMVGLAEKALGRL